MSVLFVTGDLFNVPANSYAHGVNCRGVMGAGIAKTFKARLPEMYAQYKIACDLGLLTLGDVMPWGVSRGNVGFVFNIASQDLPGPHASLEALEHGLMLSAVWARKLRLKDIALPRIGAGIGGLDWAEVKETILSVGQHVPDVDLIVVTHPKDVEETP